MQTMQHPMYMKWCIDMKRALLDALQGIEDRGIANKDEWVVFREQVRAQPYFQMRDVMNNQQFINVWHARGSALYALYEDLHWLIIRHSPPVSMTELYRERYEQALDWLSRKCDTIPPLLSCELNMESSSESVNESCDALARSILKKRSEWITKMSHIERMRRRYSNVIFSTDVIKTIEEVPVNAKNEIRRLDVQWT